jgi:hypothetical protein
VIPTADTQNLVAVGTRGSRTVVAPSPSTFVTSVPVGDVGQSPGSWFTQMLYVVNGSAPSRTTFTVKILLAVGVGGGGTFRLANPNVGPVVVAAPFGQVKLGELKKGTRCAGC